MIIYTSLYGSTARYADALSRRTGHVALAAADVSHVTDDLVVLMGPVQNAKIVDLPAMLSLVPDHARLLVVSVGMGNPELASVRSALDSAIGIQLGERTAQLFHLRGRVDYPAMSVKHKAILAMVKTKMLAIPESRRDEATRDFLESYGEVRDYTDEERLSPIIGAMRS